MVINKNQLNKNKDQKPIKTFETFETFFFIILVSLSLLFLVIICWFLFTGDEHIFLHGTNISPRYLCSMLYIQSFLLERAMSSEHEHKSELGHLIWSL
ncbi:MAG: hypothetical protein D3916_09325 [Candidatus Electrothrix sp. MAN1_4]|nr:hypothetical protein [Candidatus Electrothrix sp. MAN1_4]